MTQGKDMGQRRNKASKSRCIVFFFHGLVTKDGYNLADVSPRIPHTPPSIDDIY